MQAIQTMDLVKRYKDLTAVDRLNLEIRSGELFSLLGVNGAGKTTAIKMLSCLTKPTGGDALVGGYSITKEPERVKGLIGVSPQETAVASNLTVEENLLMGGYLVKDRQPGVERAFKMFPRLEERRSQRAGTLSGGEQQMLAIARGLMSNPKVLLLDEPSLGLAPLIVNEVINIIDEINQQGVTVLLVEQNARKALKIAHHACVMEQGRIVRYGTGDEIAQDESIVAAYLGKKK